MASLHATKSGVWNLHFRYGGRQFCRSTGTTIRKLAEAQRHAVAETIRLMGLGGFPMPAEADPATWIMSRGVLASKPKLKHLHWHG